MRSWMEYLFLAEFNIPGTSSSTDGDASGWLMITCCCRTPVPTTPSIDQDSKSANHQVQNPKIIQKKIRDDLWEPSHHPTTKDPPPAAPGFDLSSKEGGDLLEPTHSFLHLEPSTKRIQHPHFINKKRQLMENMLRNFSTCEAKWIC